MEQITNETCPMCGKKTLTLKEDEQDIPHFGKISLFSMHCSSCYYNQSDVECLERQDPAKIEFTIENEKDLHIRVVKSAEASIKIPSLKMSVTPGMGAEGYVSNIEGVLQRFKKIVESERDTTEEPEIKKKAKNLLKKIWKVECGDEALKLVIEDPSGNSAIISERALITKLKEKK